jgi:Sulfotransferase family
MRMAEADLLALSPALSLASVADAERLFAARRVDVVPVTEPLVLISQVQRSGGTLLNTLLDGHPELHVHPYELHIGHPDKYTWPALDVDEDTEKWLDTLREHHTRVLFDHGYRKESFAADSLPFLVVPSFLERLFRVLINDRRPQSERAILDAFATAYFNAWIDGQGLRDTPKRWWVGFAPRLAWGDNRQGFWRAYPDGRLVTSLRDPRGWLGSVMHSATRIGVAARTDPETAFALYRHAVAELCAAKVERPDQTFVVCFEQLVGDPTSVMRRLAAWLGIADAASLIRPTMNGIPVPANSSFADSDSTVQAIAAERWRHAVRPELLARIERELAPLHRDALTLAD